MDRVLDGSTSEVWLDPRVEHLRGLGVRFQVGWTAESLALEDGQISSVGMRDPSGARRNVSADWVISAIPVERFAPLLDDALLAADPSLAGVKKLRTDWMNGLMFYLKQQVPITPGHVNYVDAPWAITSISQGQFWRRDFATTGDGTVSDCLSTIISDWTAPGMFKRQSGQGLRAQRDRARGLGPDQGAPQRHRRSRADLNALLDAAGSAAPHCQVTPLFRPPEFEPVKEIDRQRYRLGLPNMFDVLDPRAP